MHEPFDEQRVELHEDAERRDAVHHPAVFLAELVTHEVALEPGLDVARRLVRAPLVRRAVQAELFPDRGVGARAAARLVVGLLHRACARRQRGVQLEAVRRLRHILLARQDRVDRAVREQVRIAADRAREVRIGFVGETEVADVVRAVHGLLHRAQQHRLQHLRVGPVADLRHQRGVVARMRLVAAAEREPHAAQERAQVLELLGRRPRMHAVQARMLVALQEVGRADVRRQHALLDQLVRVVALARHDLLDLALRVADDIRLGRVEVDRAALLARGEQRLVDAVQVLQVRQQLRPACGLRPFRVRQHRRDFRIGQTRGRMDDGRIELVRLDLAARRDHDVAREHAAVDLRIQRAQAVRQFLRQHRDHAAREIDRRAALERVGVEPAARLHVVRHVGDRDDQPEAVAAADLDRLAVDRIVEVARVLAVDRHERHVAQVDAEAQVGRAHLVRQRGGIVERRLAELVRHAVLAHRDLDLHARIVDVAEHLDDAAERLRMAAREIGQLDDDDLPDLRLLHVLRDQDVVADALVFGRDDQRAVLVEQAADHALVRALGHLDDMPFGAAAAVVADDPRQHAVVVHHLLHLAVRQEQVILAVVADHEAVAVAMALHATGDEVRRMGELVMPALVEADLAVALHRGDAPEEPFALLTLDRQGFGDVVGGQRRVARTQHAENLFTARNGVRIFAQGFVDDCSRCVV
ncbi:hypothetical protein BPS26883_06741 [Burkholderia pseudomultivorans]|uniref:Uncharacterized protein n=1 Tax=Burkholderia pseudomultivorans TaxID=1207504 RepID=A0A6P2RUI4_9BURK|nr:hypothetical protein BPS26883_06741 [Burkholderia pseudomultivorans]